VTLKLIYSRMDKPRHRWKHWA